MTTEPPADRVIPPTDSPEVEFISLTPKKRLGFDTRVSFCRQAS